MSEETIEDEDEITEDRPFGRFSDYYKAVPTVKIGAKPRVGASPVEVLAATEADREFTAYLEALTKKYGGRH